MNGLDIIENIIIQNNTARSDSWTGDWSHDWSSDWPHEAWSNNQWQDSHRR